MSIARVEEITVYERDYDELLAEHRDDLVTDGVNLDDREAVVRAVWALVGAGAFDQGDTVFDVKVLDA